LNDLLDNKVSPVFQLFFIEGLDMPPNIPEASANPMALTTQQTLGVTIASFISTTSGIPIASRIPDGIQLDSDISARSSIIPLASTISYVIPVQSGIPEASVVPPPVSPHFTPTVPTVLTPTAPIPAPVPRQTIVSPAWLEDSLRYKAAITPPSCILLETLITPKVEPVFLHLS
jgi:hypothetical protein